MPGAVVAAPTVAVKCAERWRLNLENKAKEKEQGAQPVMILDV